MVGFRDRYAGAFGFENGAVGAQFTPLRERCALPPGFVPGASTAVLCRPCQKALWINVFDFTHLSEDTGQTLKGFLCAEPQRKRMRLS